MKDVVYFLVGAILFILGVIMVLTGIVLSVSPPAGTPRVEPGETLVLGTLCTATGIVPGLLLIWLGFRARRFRKELDEFSGWVKAYRRIPLPELARKLGKSEMEAEKLLTSVVDKGLVRGFIDRTTNEFVIPEAVFQQVQVAFCPRCGGSVNRTYMVGETVLCPYCGSVIPPGVGRPL